MYSAQQLDNDIANWKTMGFTKQELVIKIAEACMGWPYVYGERGEYDTPSLRRSRANGLDQSMPDEAAVIRRNCQVLNGSKGDCRGCKWYPGGAKVRCFDCRGFTYWVLKQIGIEITGVGATSQWNTDNNWSGKGILDNLPTGQVCCVFQYDSSKNNMKHTGLYVGGGRIIHCSGEVKVGRITDRGWTHFAIPKGLEGDVPVPVWRSTIRKGSTGDDVVFCQECLIKLGYDLSPYGADGKFGNKTVTAVKAFQKDHNLATDGVVGPMTWEAIEDATRDGSLYTVTIKHLPLYQAEALKARYDGAVIIKEEDT